MKAFVSVLTLLLTASVSFAESDPNATILCSADKGAILNVQDYVGWHLGEDLDASLSPNADAETQRLFAEFLERCSRGLNEERGVRVQFERTETRSLFGPDVKGASISSLVVNDGSVEGRLSW